LAIKLKTMLPPRPFFALAPMYDVTDSAFRRVMARRGRPDIFYTEFVSCDGLLSVGREKLRRELYFTEIEQPIVAQVFGANPETVFGAAQYIKGLGFRGLDINMGCPDQAVIKQGAGSALIKNPSLAREIIAAAKDGAAELPVSVKTRIGFNKIEFETWLPHIIEAKPSLVTVHLRTKKEMSKVPAHWELMPAVKDVFAGTGIPLAGNGDVRTIAEAREKAERYGLDGVMVGRGAFGDPWFFSGHKASQTEKFEALKEHVEIFADLYLPGPTNDRLFAGHTKSFDVMKKHFKAYVTGFPRAGELRERLYAATSPEEVCAIIDSCLT
jgi:nifR3 family TIM-barrel protein